MTRSIRVLLTMLGLVLLSDPSFARGSSPVKDHGHAKATKTTDTTAQAPEPQPELTVEDVTAGAFPATESTPAVTRDTSAPVKPRHYTLLIGLAAWVFLAVCKWKLFQKAGQPPWAAVIPLYNRYITLKITGSPSWWMVMFLVPGLNLVFILLLNLKLRRAFATGDEGGLPRLSSLAFGDAQYRGDGWWDKAA